MASLLYKEDFDAARDRMTTWWQGGDIGRPAMAMSVPREEPIPTVPPMATPDGWVTGYSTSNYDYRVNLSRRACADRYFLAEAFPMVSPDLAPNSLALYLGCEGVEEPGTVWCKPFIEDPDTAVFTVDPDNFYWNFSKRLGQEQLDFGKDRYLVQFPDLIEGLDTLAAMRDTQQLLVDLIERPGWVSDSLAQITQCYFECYDVLYDMFKDDRGGSHFWAWAPGRMSKLQCDFSAMISPEMFGAFMVPVLTEMTDNLDYSMYHWDGPGAIPHHDHLLSIPNLTMLQWTPGAGVEGVLHKRWWPLYHKSLEAGKKLLVSGRREQILEAKKEFGEGFKQFLIQASADTLAEADELLREVML